MRCLSGSSIYALAGSLTHSDRQPEKKPTAMNHSFCIPCLTFLRQQVLNIPTIGLSDMRRPSPDTPQTIPSCLCNQPLKLSAVLGFHNRQVEESLPRLAWHDCSAHTQRHNLPVFLKYALCSRSVARICSQNYLLYLYPAVWSCQVPGCMCSGMWDLSRISIEEAAFTHFGKSLCNRRAAWPVDFMLPGLLRQDGDPFVEEGGLVWLHSLCYLPVRDIHRFLGVSCENHVVYSAQQQWMILRGTADAT